MSETYQIITDDKLFREFIDWLPDLEVNEKYYGCLFCRKKYCHDMPWIKSDKGQLKRFTTDKEYFYGKVAQLECKLGAYRVKGEQDKPVPQEALALYVTPNPRDLWKATLKGISVLATLLECSSKNANPHAEILSEIQRSCSSNKKYIPFDLDSKDEKTIMECIDLCEGYCDVVETRGGYHIFVHKDKVGLISNKKWYPNIAKYCDVTGDNMTPPWGTYQGGFTPHPVFRITDREKPINLKGN
jgi:hypothetical protein